MSIKINGNKGFAPVNEAKKSNKSQSAKGTGKAGSVDKVAFSSVLQEVSHAKQANSAAGAERTEKIQALKEQIAEGSYQPDLQKVAASLLRFLIEEKI